MDLRLQNKVVIVTGGAKGIGAGIVKLLAEEGAVPVIIGRNESDNLKVVNQIIGDGGRCFQVAADLAIPDECERAVKEVLSRFERIDGLVNNAGGNDGVGLETGNYIDFMESLHQNLVHYYLVAHFALMALIESKGPIINIGSKIAETGQGNTSAFAAAAGARNALTREWAVELLKYNIRVNSVIVSECWTCAYTEWLKKFEHPETKVKEINGLIPFENRMTTIEEIANTVAFLLSEKSSHTTGQIINVDGGYIHLDRALSKIS